MPYTLFAGLLLVGPPASAAPSVGALCDPISIPGPPNRPKKSTEAASFKARSRFCAYPSPPRRPRPLRG